MIISRTTFTLRFGQAKPAIALWKQIMDVKMAGVDKMPMRLLTDVSGPNYTLVHEYGMRGFTDLGPGNHVWTANEQIRALYPQFVPLCESSRNDLLHVEHQVGMEPPPGFLVERMCFRVRYGQARDAIAIWKEALDLIKGNQLIPYTRLLTDITGPSYQVIMEMYYRNMLDFGPKMGAWLSDQRLRDLHQRFVPLCEQSERTLYGLEYAV